MSIDIPGNNEILAQDDANEKYINKKESIDKNNLKTKSKPENKKTNKVLSNLIIILITFVALIFIIDTFKYNISTFLPEIIPLLDIFYETIFDLQLFLKDLIS